MATVGDIFRAEFPGYASARGVRSAAFRAARAIMACRTAALGGHEERCPDGHYVRSHYNSCKHRACPQCRGLEMARWLDRQVARYGLSCPYHHVVFTVPRELVAVWRYNRELFGNVLLSSSSDALMTLLKDPKYLGALPGMTATLHTWGRSGIEHPHAHFLVTAGGWTAEGWKACRDAFFVPYAALRVLYRGKFLAALRRELDRGNLVIPQEMDRTALSTELNRLSQVDWHVQVMDRYAGATGVLQYFSRYVRGGPISNSQILRYENHEVTFAYQSHQTGKRETMKLSAEEFIRRLLEHVPEKGYRVTRYYGLFSPSHRDRLEQSRSWLKMAPYEAPAPLTLETYLAQRQLEPAPTRCPTCDKALVRETISRTPLDELLALPSRRPMTRAHGPPKAAEDRAAA